MDLLHAVCAGLDVHKDMVVACVRVTSGTSAAQYHTRSFSTMTRELLALSDWLTKLGCTHVAMEATGVYWRPVWHLLEGDFELVLGNANHMRTVPGRKSDVMDAQWIADLMAHGLIRGSFVPPAPIQALRSLTRTRKQLTREIAQHTQRIQKTLEDANLKLSSVVSNVLGVSGRAILDAIVDGQDDPKKLAALKRARLRASKEALAEALTGKIAKHHRFLLKLHLEQIDHLTAAIAELEKEVGDLIEPFRERVELLVTMPGVSTTVANVIVSEIGLDMTRFPSAQHLVSWAGLCPRSDQSAGKRRSNRLRHGAPWLKTTLVQAAWAAIRVKNSYVRAQFLRLKSRRGPKKAIVAVAASMLTAAYYMLRDGVAYRDLGHDHFERTDKAAHIRRLLRRLRDLGCQVDVQPAA